MNAYFLASIHFPHNLALRAYTCPYKYSNSTCWKDPFPVARYGLSLFTNILFCIEKIAFPLYNAKVSAIVLRFPKKSRYFFTILSFMSGESGGGCRYLSDVQLYSLIASGVHPESIFFRILSLCSESSSKPGILSDKPVLLKLDLVTQHGQDIGAFGDLHSVCEEIVVDPLVYWSTDEVFEVDRKETRCPAVVDAPVDSHIGINQGWKLFLECPALVVHHSFSCCDSASSAGV